MEQKNTDISRRGRRLKNGRRGNGPVVYWMHRDQRVEDNWALLWAQQEAVARKKSLTVIFFLCPEKSGLSDRQISFILPGIQELQTIFTTFGITFYLLRGDPAALLPEFILLTDAHLLVTDFEPLNYKQNLNDQLCNKIVPPFYEVDSHNIIPAWIASQKKEYAAYTIRPKIHRLLDDYLTGFPPLLPHPFPCQPLGFTLNDMVPPSSYCAGISPDVTWIEPGEKKALRAAEHFVRHKLAYYKEQRNNPCVDGQSNLSPYLHFGQLSPQRLARTVQSAQVSEDQRSAFLEELIVRRELADNFCLYEPMYERVEGFSDWARKSLSKHRDDPRDYLYPLAKLEKGETDDILWNCCQRNLVKTGKLNGYLRMYWAKKILEWTAEPEEAMNCAMYLNDHYSLDGRDPNGYTGIAWSIGGVHDRAWKERPVFGKIRYMNSKGCRRKFDVDRYVEDSVQTTL